MNRMSTGTIEYVEISADRLKQLEQIESTLPKMIEDALKEYKQAALKRLHEKDKANPEAVNLRARRYAQKNREVLNAKRREKRRLEKLAKEESAKAQKRTDALELYIEPVNVSLRQDTIMTTRDHHPAIDNNDGRTVRFD